MRQQFHLILEHESGARLGVNPEHLHDMRVAARRVRAALRTFRQALPAKTATALSDELRWLRDVLGTPRDLDVYLLVLTQATGSGGRAVIVPDAYIAALKKECDRSRLAMLKALDQARYRRLVSRLDHFLSAGPCLKEGDAYATRATVTAAPKLIRDALRRVRRAGRALTPESTPAELHRFRILCKRLRYACEFLADIYGKPIAAFIARVIDLQDVLGDHHDLTVGRQRLLTFVEGQVGTSSDRLTNQQLERLLRWHNQRLRAAHRQALAQWDQFDRRSVARPLLSAMKADSIAQVLPTEEGFIPHRQIQRQYSPTNCSRTVVQKERQCTMPAKKKDAKKKGKK
jgi:CHAD domain-containing protein